MFAKVFKLDYDSFKADVTWERNEYIKYNSTAVHVGSTDVLDFDVHILQPAYTKLYINIK